MKYLPERVILSLVLCLGTINMLAQRVNLSIAILCMTSRCTIRDNNSTSNKYPIRVVQNSSGCSIESFNETKTVIDGPFDWDRSNWGVLLGVIFWGYFLGQIPAGILIQKFSVRSVLLTSLILMSTSTILVPVVAIRSLYLFCAVRVLTGLTSASWFPGFYQLWAAWAPPNERGLLIGFAYAGLHVGSAITMPITGALCQTSLGWSLVFYFYGAVSFVYCMIWFMFVYDEPKLNPRISMKEKTYLESTCPVIMKNSQGKIPIKSILTSLPVWAFIVVNIGIDWNLYTFLTSVPTYMREVLHFDFQQNALLSSLPYIGMWIGQLIFGWISDILLTRRILTLSVVRKLMNSIGMFGPALLMILITLFDYHNKYAVVILLTFGLFLSSGVFSGGMLSPIEITPKYSGLLFSASNSLGALTGFLSPVVANALTPDKTYEQWRYVFYLGSVIFLIAGFFFLIFSSSNIQSWAIEVIDYDDDDDVADNHHSLTDKSFSPTICQINKENIENEHKEFDQIHSNVVSIT
ncbi:unnamed protein product [Schistosoma intercalatum]|nr:unnamed protein product [Schistosoma intercalatum]CAH8514193.1 unnamed protein product [Schistosoma intercalatum]CAH8522961.1 unnamed protein product [Schistosoma bovis]